MVNFKYPTLSGAIVSLLVSVALPVGAQKAASCTEVPAVRSAGLGGTSGSQPAVTIAQDSVAQAQGASANGERRPLRTSGSARTPGLGGMTGGAPAAYPPLTAQDFAAPNANARNGIVTPVVRTVGGPGLGGTSGAVAFGRPAPDPDAEECAANL